MTSPAKPNTTRNPSAADGAFSDGSLAGSASAGDRDDLRRLEAAAASPRRRPHSPRNGSGSPSKRKGSDQAPAKPLRGGPRAKNRGERVEKVASIDAEARDRKAGEPSRRGRFRNGSVAVLGLVGGLGAGKSTIAAELARRGAFVLDADAIGHALLRQRPARDEVLRRFGPKILDPTDPSGQTIDRAALGAIVFRDVKARRDLEKILHPRMRETLEKAIARVVRKRQARLIVLDAAILFEAGWNRLCDLVAFVSAPEPVRLARLSAQRGWTKETLRARQSAQWPLDQKRELADFTLENSGTASDSVPLADRLDSLWQRLTHRRPPRLNPTQPEPEVEPEPQVEPEPRRSPIDL